MAGRPAGYNAAPADKSTMSFGDNFTGFWTVWKHRIVRRDYALLDDIHPGRIRSVEQWLRQEDESGRASGRGGLWDRLQPEQFAKETPILKLSEDGVEGAL
jgi:hypothetical protein